jgi:hypothetical protein
LLIAAEQVLEAADLVVAHDPTQLARWRRLAVLDQRVDDPLDAGLLGGDRLAEQRTDLQRVAVRLAELLAAELEDVPARLVAGDPGEPIMLREAPDAPQQLLADVEQRDRHVVGVGPICVPLASISCEIADAAVTPCGTVPCATSDCPLITRIDCSTISSRPITY